MSNCKLCGEPMPNGEEMFLYHGYSGPCPKPTDQRSADIECPQCGKWIGEKPCKCDPPTDAERGQQAAESKE